MTHFLLNLTCSMDTLVTFFYRGYPCSVVTTLTSLTMVSMVTNFTSNFCWLRLGEYVRSVSHFGQYWACYYHLLIKDQTFKPVSLLEIPQPHVGMHCYVSFPAHSH